MWYTLPHILIWYDINYLSVICILQKIDRYSFIYMQCNIFNSCCVNLQILIFVSVLYCFWMGHIKTHDEQCVVLPMKLRICLSTNEIWYECKIHNPRCLQLNLVIPKIGETTANRKGDWWEAEESYKTFLQTFWKHYINMNDPSYFPRDYDKFSLIKII